MSRLVLLLLVPLVVGCAAVSAVPRPPSAPSPGVSAMGSAPARPAVVAAAALRDWDARRADAWSRGSVLALRALYAPGSVAGAADVAMLRAWRRRGLRVDRLTTQLLAVRVLGSGPGRYRLRVRDRVVGGAAVGNGVHEGLGRGRIRSEVVTLVRRNGTWLVASAT